MNTVFPNTGEADLSKFENISFMLWLRQTFRKLRGGPLLQDVVLGKVVSHFKTDKNLLGILLFGSLATSTHTWKSDIDLIFVYDTHEPDAGMANRFVDGIAVQYFFTTIKTLIHNQETVPYLLIMFAEAKILFDRFGSVSPLIQQLQQYFTEHSHIADEWVRYKQLHQAEKKGPVCAQTTIIQRWDELEDKYSGGTHKRTFFRVT